MKYSTQFLLNTLLFLILFSCQNTDNQTNESPPKKEEHIIFIGTYTEKEPHVDGKGEGIYVYKMDKQTGALSYLHKAIGIENPSYLTPHPNGEYLYAASEISGKEGSISAFAIDQNSYNLKLLNKVSSRGIAPCYISTNEAGKAAFVANYVTGNVGMLPILENGQIEEAVAVINHEKSKSNHPRQKKPHAHFFAPDPDGQLAYAVDLGLDKVFAYYIDTINGGLLPAKQYAMTSEFAGSRHLTWHPQQPWMYIVNELNSRIEGFQKTDTLAEFAHFQTISTLPEGGKNGSSADIHITPNGRFLYASNRGNHNNLAMYQIDQNTGQLTLIGHQSTKGKAPRNFLITPDGQFLLAANQDSDNIVTFKINQETGRLEDTGLEVTVPTPVCLKMVVY